MRKIASGKSFSEVVYYFRRRKGICVRCPADAEPNSATCRVCKVYIREYQRVTKGRKRRYYGSVSYAENPGRGMYNS